MSLFAEDYANYVWKVKVNILRSKVTLMRVFEKDGNHIGNTH